ncbi:hypothetical protein JD969_00535 [Planctomycetota bacterium]|nr:hypothetical protein JD969_00535 [Planctomycetota bacterium]
MLRYFYNSNYPVFSISALAVSVFVTASTVNAGHLNNVEQWEEYATINLGMYPQYEFQYSTDMNNRHVVVGMNSDYYKYSYNHAKTFQVYNGSSASDKYVAASYKDVAIDTNTNRVVIGGVSNEDYGYKQAKIFHTSGYNPKMDLTPQPTTGKYFGYGIAVDGEHVVVGSAQHDDSIGKLFVYNVNSDDVILELKKDNFIPKDGFGLDVALSGNIAMARGKYLTGDGSVSNNYKYYFFDVTTGEQITTFVPEDKPEGDWYDSTFAISGNVAIIGDANVNSNGTISGAAYLYDIANDSLITKLTPDDLQAEDQFGISVDIHGRYAIVGSRGSDIDGVENAGAAYVFDTSSGEQLAKLTMSEPEEYANFGTEVSVSGLAAFAIAPGAKVSDSQGSSDYRYGQGYLFSAVPEASTLTLCVLGLVPLISRNRKKQ